MKLKRKGRQTKYPFALMAPGSHIDLPADHPYAIKDRHGKCKIQYAAHAWGRNNDRHFMIHYKEDTVRLFCMAEPVYE